MKCLLSYSLLRMILWRVVTIACIAAVGLVGNILSVVVLVRQPGVMAETQKIIINQSVIDGAASLILLFSRGFIEAAIGTRIYFTDHWFYALLCNTWGHNAFLWGLFMTSTYNLILLTIERCLKITVPFWYRKHVTPAVIYTGMAFAWIFGNVFQNVVWHSLFEIDTENMTCKESADFFESGRIQIAGSLTVVFEFLLPMACLIVCYSFILSRIRKQSKTRHQGTNQGSSSISTSILRRLRRNLVTTHSVGISTSASVNQGTLDTATETVSGCKPGTSQQASGISVINQPSATENSNTRNTQPSKYKASEMKVIQTVSVVCGAFFLCYLPNFVLLLLGPVLELGEKSYWFAVADMFAYMNCAANPLIYVGMHEAMRHRFLKTIQFWK